MGQRLISMLAIISLSSVFSIFIPINAIFGLTNGDVLKGALTSLQNGEDGKPAWIISGVFRIENFNSSSPVINASFYMIKLDGTSPHTHTISDFKINGSPTVSNNSTTLNGTVTVTMKNGPVKDVPISVKLMGNSAVSFWFDPVKTEKHFGDTVIYGTQHLICVEKPEYCK
jgi:hypothetical protein